MIVGKKIFNNYTGVPFIDDFFGSCVVRIAHVHCYQAKEIVDEWDASVIVEDFLADNHYVLA